MRFLFPRLSGLSSLLACLLTLAACGEHDGGVDAGADAPDTSPDGGADSGPDGADASEDTGERLDSSIPLPEGEVFETQGRLSVADANSGVVSVWDLDVGAEVTRYTLTSPAQLHTALSRQITAVVAAQPDSGRFDVLGVGVWVWDHVEHFHVYKEPSAIQVDPMLAMEDGLTEANATGGWIVAFDSDTGRVNALFERSIGNLRTDVDRTRAPVWRTYMAAPHSGAAVVSRGHLLVSRPDEGVELLAPGASAFGEPTLIDVACAAPSSATAVGLHAIFACEDGFMLSTWDETREEFGFERLEGPEGAAPHDWVAEVDAPAFVGLSGDDALVLVNREDAEVRRVEIGEAIHAIALDRDGRWLLALSAGGELLDLDPATGDERRRVRVVESLPGALAVGDGFAYVADPEEERVIVIDLEGFALDGELDVGMAAGSLAVTALWPGGEPVMH